MKSVGGLILAVVGVTLAGLILPPSAYADARYVKSFPAQGSNVGAGTKIVSMVFSERLNQQGSSITVIGPDGSRADQGDSRVDSDNPYGQSMRASLKSGLRPGKYTVKWTTVSAVDGHTLSDSFSFTMTPFLTSEPAPGAELKGIPSMVKIGFGERLNPTGSSITVTGDDGARVDQGDASVEGDQMTMHVFLKPGLEGGKFFVKWTVVSAETGDVITDSYGFHAVRWQPAPAPPTPLESAGVPTASSRPAILPKSGGLPIALPLGAGSTFIVAGLVLRKLVPQR